MLCHTSQPAVSRNNWITIKYSYYSTQEPQPPPDSPYQHRAPRKRRGEMPGSTRGTWRQRVACHRELHGSSPQPRRSDHLPPAAAGAALLPAREQQRPAQAGRETPEQWHEVTDQSQRNPDPGPGSKRVGGQLGCGWPCRAGTLVRGSGRSQTCTRQRPQQKVTLAHG